jgi:hypothetical protein
MRGRAENSYAPYLQRDLIIDTILSTYFRIPFKWLSLICFEWYSLKASLREIVRIISILFHDLERAMAIINGDNSSNTLTAVEASFIYGNGGNDTINGSNFNDIAQGGAGNDTVYGNGGNDVIIGDGGTDTLYGGDGDDLVVGDNVINTTIGGNDLLSGGAGNDRLYGNYGDDRYIYSVNTGMDTINDGRTAAEVPGFGGGTDILQFNGATLDDIYAVHTAGTNDLPALFIGRSD